MYFSADFSINRIKLTSILSVKFWKYKGKEHCFSSHTDILIVFDFAFKMPSNNQFSKKLLANLRLDVETADVKFIFDVDGTTNKEITANKIILAGGSTVFRSMLYGALKETEDIKITDFSYDAFCEFINLFYSSSAVLSKENIFEVIRVVDKYDARDCLPNCEHFLINTMHKDNVCDFLEIAMKINLSKTFSDRVSALIEENSDDVFGTIGFQCCNDEVLKAILQINTMSCANELAVLNAAMDWADHRCRTMDVAATVQNKRAELGESFQLIRFMAMDIKEFLEISELYPGVFTPEEFQEMVQHKIRAQPLKLLAHFSCSKRKFPAIVIHKSQPHPFSFRSRTPRFNRQWDHFTF